MPVRFLAKAKPFGDYPIADTEDIQHGTKRLDAALSDIETVNERKADKTYVDAELAKKADSTTVSALDAKVDKLSTYVTPEMFGAVGDGITDNTNSLKSMFDYVYSIGGGCVKFPKGQYNISDTILIPPNTKVSGTGFDTFIYLTQGTEYGTALGNGGSNVTIENIRVGFVGDDELPVNPPDLGGIGFSNLNYERTNTIDVTNLVARNIYSTGRYPIQTEPSQQHKITNLLYDGIFAPNGQVSISPNGGVSGGIGNNIFKAVATNVFCSAFRIGYGNNGCGSCEISNVNASYMRLVDNNIKASNIFIRLDDENNNFYRAGLYNECVKFMGSNICVDNMSVIGGNLPNCPYGVQYDCDIRMNNVKVSNFYSMNVHTNEYISGYFSNCDFTDTKGTESLISGDGVNTKVNTSSLVNYYGKEERIDHSINFNSAYSQLGGYLPSIIYRVGRKARVKIILNYTGSNIKDDTNIGSMYANSVRPKEAQWILGWAIDCVNNVSYPLPTLINTDGSIVVKPTSTLCSYENVSLVVIDGEYYIKQ